MTSAQFSWVKAHCGTTSNEAADRYAGRGAGLPDAERDFKADLHELVAATHVQRKQQSQALMAPQRQMYPKEGEKASSHTHKQNAAFRSGIQASEQVDENWLLSDDQLEAELSA